MQFAARWTSPLLIAVAAALLFEVMPATAQQLVPQITTGRGCRETGDDPVYAIGESIALTFRIGSATNGRANTTLIDQAPDNRVVVLSFGQLNTNQSYRFSARIGGPTGIETLILRATAQGTTAQSTPCSFRVSGGTPVPTRTVATRTPTPTRTPRSATPTPNDDLAGTVRTNRGCREDGDAATFAIGETIVIALQLNSDSSPRANASLLTSRPGSQTLIGFGSVPTNVPLSLAGRIGAPSGTRTLTLRGSLSGSQTALDTCSYLVVGALPPVATPTRRATRTSTPTRTGTPTRTFTPPAGFCVGACTQPGNVTVNDLLTVIEIAAGRASIAACPSADANGDQQVSLEEVLQAVNNALDGCPN